MTSKIGAVAFALVLAGWTAGAAAQDAAPPNLNSLPGLDALADRPGQDASRLRFRFTRVSDGILRLDSETGQVSLCSARSVGWACEAVPDDRAALDKEIGRLQSQVDGLNKEVADLRGTAPAPPPSAGNSCRRRSRANQIAEPRRSCPRQGVHRRRLAASGRHARAMAQGHAADVSRLSAIASIAPQLLATATLSVETDGAGFMDITRDAAIFLRETKAGDGALLLYLRHTSASLVIPGKCRS